MSRWTYYSPFFVAIVIVLALNQPIRSASVSTWALNAPWKEYVVLSGIALVAAVVAQVGMLGFQGAFAQVLPVPVGRSIRGPAAARAGWLLLAALLLGATTSVLWLQGISIATYVVCGAGAAALLGAALLYFWNIPAAIADFPPGD